MTGPRFQKQRNQKQGKAELSGVFRPLALSRSTRGKEAWSGRRPCSLPSDQEPSLFLFSVTLSPSAEIQPSVPGSPRSPSPPLHRPQLSSASSPFMIPLFLLFIGPLFFFCFFVCFCFFFLLPFGMVWLKYIALIHVAFASEDLAVTLGRPRWYGILVDPPASVSTRVQGLGV